MLLKSNSLVANRIGTELYVNNVSWIGYTFLFLQETKAVFRDHYDYQLTLPEHLDFLSLWYFQIVTSDAMAIAGSILKIYIRYGVSHLRQQMFL